MEKKTELSGYELSRTFFDWSFANPDLVRPNHIALYFFCIEHNNRLGWKEKFGLPTTMTMEAIGIKSYNTYISTFNDLVKWGFVKLIEKSKNQYSANVIGLSKNNKAITKALDKALIKHGTKQSESTEQSTDSIDKQVTKNKEQLTERKQKFADTLKPFIEKYGREMLLEFYNYWTEPNQKMTKLKFELQKTWGLERRLATWKKNESKFNNDGKSKAGKHAANASELDKLEQRADDHLDSAFNPERQAG